MARNSGIGLVSLGGLAIALAAAVGVAGFGPAGAQAAAGAEAAAGEGAAPEKAANSADLGGAQRFLTALSTDKPIYRANEIVRVRAILLDAATHQPKGDTDPVSAHLQITGPLGETEASADVAGRGEPIAFGWSVPDSASGGEYTLRVTYPALGYAPAERKFDVRIYRAPRLRSQITFLRDGYGPGDKVTATVHSERAAGGFPAGAKVTVTARVDDQEVFTGPAAVNAAGDCTATFALPKAIERGEGTLAFAIEDGGVVETAAKTIPILLQTVNLAIYPEGGDPVAGVDNRFYVEAKTPFGKPADLVGAISDSKGKQVAAVRTEHEGRGRFDFTPLKGETYTLKLSQPAGITKTWTVPAANESGVAIRTLDDIVQKDQPVRVKISPAGNVDGYRVTLTRHETDVLAEQDAVRDGVDAPYVVLKPRPGADGVLTLTVWGADGTPLAERLIYRQPEHQIHVQVTPAKESYTPGGQGVLSIVTTDEDGKPISADVGVTVTDDTVLQMVEKREQAPQLPAMVFLEPEVRELADAQVYLDPQNKNGPLDTDLLLGTQGWRRFALVKPGDFLEKSGDAGKRALAFEAPPEPGAFMGARRSRAADLAAEGEGDSAGAEESVGAGVLADREAGFHQKQLRRISRTRSAFSRRGKRTRRISALNLGQTNWRIERRRLSSTISLTRPGVPGRRREAISSRIRWRSAAGDSAAEAGSAGVVEDLAGPGAGPRGEVAAAAGGPQARTTASPPARLPGIANTPMRLRRIGNRAIAAISLRRFIGTRTFGRMPRGMRPPFSRSLIR